MRLLMGTVLIALTIVAWMQWGWAPAFTMLFVFLLGFCLGAVGTKMAVAEENQKAQEDTKTESNGCKSQDNDAGS